jgi:hypothetical protein
VNNNNNNNNSNNNNNNNDNCLRKPANTYPTSDHGAFFEANECATFLGQRAEQTGAFGPMKNVVYGPREHYVTSR